MKITLQELKKIIQEEQYMLSKPKTQGWGVESTSDAAKQTKKEEASQMNSLEHKIDWMKALKIKEAKLVNELKKVRIAQNKIKKSRG